MVIEKIFNNNVLQAYDEHNNKFVLIGRGLAFQKKPGEDVDQDKVLQTFVLSSNDVLAQFNVLMNQVPSTIVSLSAQIIEMAQKELQASFSTTTMIGLTDHINYALERVKNQQPIRNMLVWEVKKFYEREFQVAEKAVKLLEKELDVSFTEDEVGFIALHFVNGQLENGHMNETIVATKTLDDILSIVQMHYSLALNQESVNYVRFVTHVKFFIKRILSQEMTSSNEDELFEQIKEKYDEAYRCTYKIKKYLKESLNIDMGNDEMLYFMLHINRVTQRQN